MEKLFVKKSQKPQSEKNIMKFIKKMNEPKMPAIASNARKLCVDKNGSTVLDGSEETAFASMVRILLKKKKTTKKTIKKPIKKSTNEPINMNNVSKHKPKLWEMYQEFREKLFKLKTYEDFVKAEIALMPAVPSAGPSTRNEEMEEQPKLDEVEDEDEDEVIVEDERTKNIDLASDTASKLVPSPLTFPIENCFITEGLDQDIQQLAVENEQLVCRLSETIHQIGLLAEKSDFPALEISGDPWEYDDSFDKAFVIPIVFEKDPEWVKSHRSIINNIDKRVMDHGASELAIKKILQFTKGKIFLILAQESQLECEQAVFLQSLLSDRRIEIVYHSAFIPEKLLPTINSLTIERYMVEISELPEEFVYANDDTFLMRQFPKDYFDSWHCSKKDNHLFKESRNPGMLFYQSNFLGDYKKMCINNAKLCKELEWEPCMSAHGMKLFRKSILREVCSLISNYDYQCSKVRSHNDPMITMVLYGSYLSFKATTCTIDHQSPTSEISRQMLQYIPITDTFDFEELSFQTCLLKPPVVLCLNDWTTSTDGHVNMRNAIEKIRQKTDIPELDILKLPLPDIRKVSYNVLIIYRIL